MIENTVSGAEASSSPLEWAVALCGLVVALLVVLFAPDARLVVGLVTTAVGALVIWIVWQDLKTYTISNSAILSVALLAFAVRWCNPGEAFDPPLWRSLALFCDAALPGGLLLVLREVYYRRTAVDCLGLGDVKLAAAGGLLVGTSAFCWALFSASLLALTAVAASRSLSKVPIIGSDRIAFGAFLAPVLWAIFVAQQIDVLFAFASGGV